MVVVIIVGIISAVVIPNYNRSLVKAKVGASNAAAAVLVGACELAITDDDPVEKDDVVKRLKASYEGSHLRTVTVSKPDTCKVSILDSLKEIKTSGTYEAFGNKTSAKADSWPES